MQVTFRQNATVDGTPYTAGQTVDLPYHLAANAVLNQLAVLGDGEGPVGALPGGNLADSIAQAINEGDYTPSGSWNFAGATVTGIEAEAGLAELTYANALPGTRVTILYQNGGWADPASGGALQARPSARADIYFDLIGGSSAVADPAWMLNGDAREIVL